MNGRNLSINVGGRLMDFARPRVMGILNVTSDSFFSDSRKLTEKDILERAREIVEQGGDIIDVGACSTRPGAMPVSVEEESERLSFALNIIRRELGDEVPVSVDTFRADVARMCVSEFGADIINDISAGDADADMFRAVAELRVPYVLMHMQGTPADMQVSPHYDDLFREVFSFFESKVEQLRELGVNDIILDPGFGFGKTIDHNYRLLAHLEEFDAFGLPLLVGVSRKSMIYRLLGVSPQDALNGTTVLDTVAVEKGVDILRVHDVRQAVEVVTIITKLNENRDVY